MKTFVKMAGVLALAMVVSTATAGEKSSTSDTAKKASATPPKAKKQVLTGSHIPQNGKVSGYIGVTTSPLVVIDSDMIRRSGAHDLKDLLRRGGWNR